MSLQSLSLLALLSLVGCGGNGEGHSGYQSPYSLQYTVPVESLTFDFDQFPRSDPKMESAGPYAEWYDPNGPINKTWGPGTRLYPAPNGWQGRSPEWARQRVIAAMQPLLGLNYQHHHIPAWNPPVSWQERFGTTPVLADARGVDCSNLTRFVWSYALGVRLDSDTLIQSQTTEVNRPGSDVRVPVQRIGRPATYADARRHFRTGDLLFIRNMQGEISHVITWLGDVGQGPDATPLILDSHGDAVRDAKGVTIPAGVHIRPFREDGWYFTHLSHAIRIADALYSR